MIWNGRTSSELTSKPNKKISCGQHLGQRGKRYSCRYGSLLPLSFRRECSIHRQSDEAIFEKHFKKNRFRIHGERAGAIDCGKDDQESLVSCHGYPRNGMELVCYAKTADIFKFELRCNRGALVADFPEGACKRRMCSSLDDLCRLIDHVIKHSRGRIEDLVNSLSKPLPSADSIALWWFSVLNMDRKLRLWSEALDSELLLRASRIKEEALKALIMPEGWPIRNLGVETVNFMRRMERKGYVKRHAGRYHALVKTNSNHAPLN